MLPGLGPFTYSHDDEDREPGPPREYHVSPVIFIFVFITVIALLGYFVVLPRNIDRFSPAAATDYSEWMFGIDPAETELTKR